MKKLKDISLTSKTAILIVVLLIIFFVIKKSQKQTNLGAGRKNEVDQHLKLKSEGNSEGKTEAAFEILEQIHSALVDKSKLTIIETAWFNAISQLLNS